MMAHIKKAAGGFKTTWGQIATESGDLHRVGVYVLGTGAPR